MIGYRLYRLLMKTKLGLKGSIILSIGVIYSYGILTNFSVSTNRAVVMLILLFAAKWIGRTYDGITALATGALMILCQHSMELYDIGFYILFLSVATILIVIPLMSILYGKQSFGWPY